MTSLRHTPDPRLDAYLDAARACILDVGWRRTTLTEVASGQRSGAIRSGDPVLIARTLTLAGHGFVFSAMTMTDEQVGLADLDAEYARLITRTLEP